MAADEIASLRRPSDHSIRVTAEGPRGPPNPKHSSERRYNQKQAGPQQGRRRRAFQRTTTIFFFNLAVTAPKGAGCACSIAPEDMVNTVTIMPCCAIL